MTNPEYEAKVNPTELYNDDIIAQFEAIRNVIHKEILPSTYNELVVTSNQAGTLTSYMPITDYPQTEIIFPLSPQSGNINWLEKNYLRFRFKIQSNISSSYSYNMIGAKYPDNYYNFETASWYTSSTGGLFMDYGVMDGASIFKSIELNYGGTAIWTSAYQQAEAFFTYTTLPAVVVDSSCQYWNSKKPFDSATGTGSMAIGGSAISTSFEIVVDVDISRLSPILSWLSIIPSFINKLTLRVIVDTPLNWLNRRLRIRESVDTTYVSSLYYNVIYPRSICLPMINTACATSKGEWNPSNTTWCCDICEIHQNNATMTEDTRIRLISLIQQLGGKWLYPCRYWNTSLAPIQTFSSGSINANFQFVLTGCYFRALAFAMQIHYANDPFMKSPGNYWFSFPDNVSNIEIYCDSEMLCQYPGTAYCCTDTSNALLDSDKYSILQDITMSMRDDFNDLSYSGFKDVIIKATGPPNGMYSGKYTSEKMGTHNILLKMNWNAGAQTTAYVWCSALQDGVIVFDNFNGSYFATGRKMQQVYEALS